MSETVLPRRGRWTRLRIYSQRGALPWFREHDERALWLLPDDAAARGVRDGSRVEVRSAQALVRCACRGTAEVMPGVVALIAGVDPQFDDGGEGISGWRRWSPSPWRASGRAARPSAPITAAS